MQSKTIKIALSLLLNLVGALTRGAISGPDEANLPDVSVGLPRISISSRTTLNLLSPREFMRSDLNLNTHTSLDRDQISAGWQLEQLGISGPEFDEYMEVIARNPPRETHSELSQEHKNLVWRIKNERIYTLDFNGDIRLPEAMKYFADRNDNLLAITKMETLARLMRERKLRTNLDFAVRSIQNDVLEEELTARLEKARKTTFSLQMLSSLTTEEVELVRSIVVQHRLGVAALTPLYSAIQDGLKEEIELNQFAQILKEGLEVVSLGAVITQIKNSTARSSGLPQ